EYDLVVGQALPYLLVGLREHQGLDPAFQVLEDEGGHPLALAGLDGAQAGDDRPHAHVATVDDLQQAAGGGGGPLLELAPEALQGMTGDEESEGLLLEGQPLALAPLG